MIAEPFSQHGEYPVLHARGHMSPSLEYRAWVNGKEAYVYNHAGFSGGTMSWIFLDLHHPIEIEIRPHRRVDTCRVLPRRDNIPVQCDGTSARFRIEKPGSYLVEWDEILELPFLVFARPPAEAPPAGNGRRIEFGPGHHHPGLIELHSGDELYLAPGAEVHGGIRAVGARDIRITGRGILNQSHLPFCGHGDERNPVELIDCSDVLIDGPIFLDGCTWNLVFRNCDRVHVRHVAVMSERAYSTDGINPCDSRDVLIEECFVRSKDDCISVKGMQRDVARTERVPIRDIMVRDCLFWSDNNNGLVVGTETWASEIHDVVFERTDFVRVRGTCGDWAAAFAVQALFDTSIHDIRFEDIDVEYCSGNPFSILFLDNVYGIPGERTQEGARIEKIVFRNIRFHQKPRRGSIITGRDALRRVSDVLIENVLLGDLAARKNEDLRLITNNFAEEIRFQ